MGVCSEGTPPPLPLPLPIDDILPELVNKLTAAGAIVLKAEPGAGKTTRVPPAILDAGLADLPGRVGQIVVLQPRRVAARAAAARISEERGTALGAEIGYQVRLESRVSKQTRIIVCTEGIFLRRLQEDPLIEDVAVVVFDEFHERSLDSDLSLAMTRLVREQVRPDLRVVVMSATLDSQPIAAYLGGCPVVESAGRTFPVAIEHLAFSSNTAIDRAVSDGIKQLLPETDGHVLAFLPGVGEIRQTEENLEREAQEQGLLLLPLYGDMPLQEQQEVLRPCKQRKVVLATNVAETSITIDGVTAVVDSGLARISRFDANVGLNRLELTRISKASAAQRAGRAGRTSAGRCLRLWTEREHQALPDFETPEIARLDLSEALLRLIAWGEHDVRRFPWFEPPPQAAVEAALDLLDELDALAGGALTDLGKRMSEFPLQPRLARLLLEGERLFCGRRAALAAALLAERPPFRRREQSSPRSHHSHSDVLDRVDALQLFEEKGWRDSPAGELLSSPAKQVLRARDQLCRLLGDIKDKQSSDEAMLRAIAAAFPDRLCKRRAAAEERAVMVGGRGVRLTEESAVADADLFVAVELIDLGKSELVVRQASAVERAWLPQSHLRTEVEAVFDEGRQKVVAFKRTRFCDLLLDEAVTAMPAHIDPGAVLAEAIAAKIDVESLVDDEGKSYLARVLCLRQWLPELALPDLGEKPWLTLLPEWCFGCASVADLKAKPFALAVQSRLTHDQITAIEREAPERFSLPNGRTARLQYEVGQPPVLAARIQELFGITETPRLARSRVPVLVHLLAPNYRVQQITPDLAGFWKNTYADVKKELKGRYPKHAWPDDPLKMPPVDKR